MQVRLLISPRKISIIVEKLEENHAFKKSSFFPHKIWVIPLSSANFSDPLQVKIRMKVKELVHRPGIEPGPPAWQASILPLNQRCPGCARLRNQKLYIIMYIYGHPLLFQNAS